MSVDHSLVAQILEKQISASSEISEMGKQVPNHLLTKAEAKLEQFYIFRKKVDACVTNLDGRLEEFRTVLQGQKELEGQTD